MNNSEEVIENYGRLLVQRNIKKSSDCLDYIDYKETKFTIINEIHKHEF